MVSINGINDHISQSSLDYKEFVSILDSGTVKINDPVIKTKKKNPNHLWHYIVLEQYGCNLDKFV